MTEYLVHYSLVGDANSIREVHVCLILAESEDSARERVNRWYGAGYARIIKVEPVG